MICFFLYLSEAKCEMSEAKIVGHNVFTFDDHVTFSSNFDNGNLGRVERAGNSSSNFRIWTALDNMGTEYQSKHGAWFHFMVTGLPMGCVLRIQVMNASPHGGLYKHDMVSCVILIFDHGSTMLPGKFELLFAPFNIFILILRICLPHPYIASSIQEQWN